MALTNTLVPRFRVYDPNGAAKGVLPHPLSWEVGIPLNDMSSLTMTYPDGTEASEWLKAPCEVALELRNPRDGAFTEYGGCRFLNLRWSVDANSRPGIISLNMPSYGWMLKKARFMKSTNPRLTADRKILYPGPHFPAEIIMEVLDEAHSRGNIPFLTYNFNQFIDSASASWGTGNPDRYLVDPSVDYGQDAWSMLDAFSRQNYFDWYMDKRELKVYAFNTAVARNLASNTGVHLQSRLGNQEDSSERTWEDQAGYILALGDGNSSYMYSASPGLDYYPWGLWDDVITAGGVTDTGTLQSMANKLASVKYKSRAQYTQRFVWTEGAAVPLADYRQGDFIRARNDAGSQLTTMRIFQITLSGTDPYGVSIALTLNDRFLDRALQVERWVARGNSTGGPVGGAGTGGTSSNGGLAFRAMTSAVSGPEDTSLVTGSPAGPDAGEGS